MVISSRGRSTRPRCAPRRAPRRLDHVGEQRRRQREIRAEGRRPTAGRSRNRRRHRLRPAKNAQTNATIASAMPASHARTLPTRRASHTHAGMPARARGEVRHQELRGEVGASDHVGDEEQHQRRGDRRGDAVEQEHQREAAERGLPSGSQSAPMPAHGRRGAHRRRRREPRRDPRRHAAPAARTRRRTARSPRARRRRAAAPRAPPPQRTRPASAKPSRHAVTRVRSARSAVISRPVGLVAHRDHAVRGVHEHQVRDEPPCSAPAPHCGGSKSPTMPRASSGAPAATKIQRPPRRARSRSLHQPSSGSWSASSVRAASSHSPTLASGRPSVSA